MADPFDYINRTYGLTVRKGQRVTAYGKPGVVTGVNGAYVMIRRDGEKQARPHHPTDQVVYGEAHG